MEETMNEEMELAIEEWTAEYERHSGILSQLAAIFMAIGTDERQAMVDHAWSLLRKTRLVGLESPRVVKAGEWQDISTAPKDGTVILMTSRGGIVEAGFWSGKAGFPWTILDPGQEDGVNGWMINGPSLWMPLPESPKE